MRILPSGRIWVLLFAVAAAGGAAAHGQTDVAVSGYGAFSATTAGSAVKDVPAHAGGGMIEVRHIVSRLVGFEGTYAFNGANQLYSPAAFCSLCTGPVSVSANAQEFTGDWVFSARRGKFRPFALLGAGVLHFQPHGSMLGNSPAPTQSATMPVYVYGAGADWGISSRFGLRFQYRGNFYRAPDLTLIYGSGSPGHNGGVFTHTAEPAIGIYYRF